MWEDHCYKNRIKYRLMIYITAKYVNDKKLTFPKCLSDETISSLTITFRDSFPKIAKLQVSNKRYPFPLSQGKCACIYLTLTNTRTTYIQSHRQGCACARARAVEIQAGKAEVGSPLAGSQVRARRYTRTRLASTGVPGGARRQPRTDVDTKPRPELLRTTVQRACVPRPDHGGPSERARSRKSIPLIDHYRRVTSFREREKIVTDKFTRESL